MKKIVTIFSMALAACALTTSCTKLESEMYDTINPGIFPTTEDDANALVTAAAYGPFRAAWYDGLFTLQIQGQGPVTLLVVDITGDGSIRTSVRYDEALLPKQAASLQEIFGSGVLVFTVDQAVQKEERYQGIVELSGSSLAEAVERYFQASEQILTHLILFSKELDGSIQTGGLIVQMMPSDKGAVEQRSDAFETACVLADSLRKAEFFDENLSAEKVLFRLYHADHLLLFPAKSVRFACRCSSEKVKKMLRGFSSQELEDMYQNGEIRVDCQFCGKTYCFKKGEWE